MGSPELRVAIDKDLAVVRHLLQQAKLPFEDLAPEAMQDFVLVQDANGNAIGAGGIERYESDGLLRSVVVSDAARGRGLGRMITQAIEDRARETGVTALYLLTTTAADFFPRLGYERFDRSSVPEKLRQSTEFASLCPASAVCLRKQLVAAS
ncbi:MAG: GNAT family N-acetyltransferase [Proteobacteria bacterium]|nr:GNAT family N-acetyltransferase [Pseudomonadota bacterium]